MKTYPGLTWEFISEHLPMERGWAWWSWAVENDGWLQFSGVKREGKNYIAQEIDKLMAQVKKAMADGK